MNRVAVFVDAGYLFAQGSVALAGKRQPRNSVELNQSAAIDKLKNTARDMAGDSSLLRIYWYDGLLRQTLTPEQESLAYADDVKLRLGIVNQSGQQKGVDSLIVMDLVDLARNRAISDAVLLSGDEDVRIGVQIAQSFGVRVHLIGITPSRGSQSRLLMQESDTTTEWSISDIGKVLRLNPQPAHGAVSIERAGGSATTLDEVVSSLFDLLTPDQQRLIAELGPDPRYRIPPEHDGRLLRAGSAAIGVYPLSEVDKRYLRDKLKSLARSRLADASP